MYKSSLGPSLKQKFNRKRKDQARKEEEERFSSFETPPPSDKEEEEFSDFETQRKQIHVPQKLRSSKKSQKSHILVEQMPLQYEKSASAKKKLIINDNSSAKKSRKNDHQAQIRQSPSQIEHRDGRQLKENCPSRFNYMDKIEKQLSIIKEDPRESKYSSQIQATNILPRKSSVQIPRETYYQPSSFQKMYIEQQKIKIAILQQQNHTLRERVIHLEGEIRYRDDERVRREAEIMAQKLALTSHEQYYNSTRKEAKNHLLQQISILQTKCKEMKEEMRTYKEKQEQLFMKLTHEKEEERVKHLMFKTQNQYKQKFVGVFLDMVEKLPVDIDPSWSEKKRIAIGWKILKNMVLKALKHGIQLPAIVDKEDNTSFL